MATNKKQKNWIIAIILIIVAIFMSNNAGTQSMYSQQGISLSALNPCPDNFQKNNIQDSNGDNIGDSCLLNYELYLNIPTSNELTSELTSYANLCANNGGYFENLDNVLINGQVVSDLLACHTYNYEFSGLFPTFKSKYKQIFNKNNLICFQETIDMEYSYYDLECYKGVNYEVYYRPELDYSSGFGARYFRDGTCSDNIEDSSGVRKTEIYKGKQLYEKSYCYDSKYALTFFSVEDLKTFIDETTTSSDNTSNSNSSTDSSFFEEYKTYILAGVGIIFLVIILSLFK